MSPHPQAPIMFAMTPPLKSSKVLLVPDRRAGDRLPPAVPVRRYRLVRVRF
jgi:hypothetical protein